MRAKATRPFKTFPVQYSTDEHATVTRRAKAAGLSLHAYIVELTVTGKVNRKPK